MSKPKRLERLDEIAAAVSRWRSRRVGQFAHSLRRSECQSVLECDFYHEIATHCRGGFQEARSQFRAGRYKIDFAFMIRGKWIGIEVDGAAYHDVEYDARRDAEILNCGFVDEIIRIPYASLHFYANATMQVIGCWHAEFLTAKHNTTLTREEVDEQIEYQEEQVREFGTWEPFFNREHFISRNFGCAAVWCVEGDVGWAGGVVQYLKRWGCRPILRRTVDNFQL